VSLLLFEANVYTRTLNPDVAPTLKWVFSNQECHTQYIVENRWLWKNVQPRTRQRGLIYVAFKGRENHCHFSCLSLPNKEFICNTTHNYELTQLNIFQCYTHTSQTFSRLFVDMKTTRYSSHISIWLPHVLHIMDHERNAESSKFGPDLCLIVFDPHW